MYLMQVHFPNGVVTMVTAPTAALALASESRWQREGCTVVRLLWPSS